jgi:hypothetical protein
MASVRTLKALTVLAGGAHCVWCPKTRWSPPLGASVTLKTGKNGLEVRNLRPPKVRGGHFYKKNLNRPAHSLFQNPSENP